MKLRGIPKSVPVKKIKKEHDQRSWNFMEIDEAIRMDYHRKRHEKAPLSLTARRQSERIRAVYLPRYNVIKRRFTFTVQVRTCYSNFANQHKSSTKAWLIKSTAVLVPLFLFFFFFFFFPFSPNYMFRDPAIRPRRIIGILCCIN